MKRVIGVAGMAISNSPEEVLITHSLGSCIAIVIFDGRAKVGGVLHYMLPESSMDKEKAMRNPAMFADSGISQLFRRSYEVGARKETLTVKAVGGAQMLDENGVFNIGKRNYLAMRRIFWRNNVMVSAEHVGGSVNRTVRLEMNTGRVLVKVSGLGELEL